VNVTAGDEELRWRVASESSAAALHPPGHVTATGGSGGCDAGVCNPM
jgi:hypothetical protein